MTSNLSSRHPQCRSPYPHLWLRVIAAVLLLSSTLLAARPGAAVTYATSVAEIQWRRPADANYQSAGGTLNVLKGTRLIFKAIANPSGTSFPANSPTWGGTAGASGTGETKDITFNTISTSLSDYKTITAKAANESPASLNVIVYELTPGTKAQDYFPGRSEARYGVGEWVDLKYTTQPANIDVDLVWRLFSGNGTIDNTSDVWKSGAFAITTTLKAEVNSGPSQGEFRNISRDVVAPSSVTMSNYFAPPQIGHNENSISVGARVKVALSPTDVSFSKTEVAELEAPAQGTGAFQQYTNDPLAAHPRTQDQNGLPVYIPVLKPVNSTEGSLLDGGDRIAYGTADTKIEPGVDPAGSFTWQIPYVYRVTNGLVRTEQRIGGDNYTVNQVTTVTTAGGVTVSKGSYAIAAQYGDPTVHPELTLPQLGQGN